MSFSRPVSARLIGATHVLSLLMLVACAPDKAVMPSLDDDAFMAKGTGGGGDTGPTVRAANPDTGLRATTIDVRVLGSGFDQGSRAIWAVDGDTSFATTKIKTNSTRFVKSGELVANITIGADAPLTFFDIMVVTKGGKNGIGIEKFTVKQGQTLYGFTFQGGLQTDAAHAFSALAKTGDPYYGGVSGNPVYLVLPASAGGDAAVCNATGGTLGPSTGDWGAYAGTWKGEFTIGAQGQGPGYHVTFNATREDGTGWIWLVVNADGVKSNDNLTVTFTNARGLISTYSTPTGSFDPRVGPFDPQDRCLTFSIHASP